MRSHSDSSESEISQSGQIKASTEVDVEIKTKAQVGGEITKLGKVTLNRIQRSLNKDQMDQVLSTIVEKKTEQLLVDEKISSEIQTPTSLRQGAPSVE